ncbi:hypothetical protein PQQ51_33550 [Paraburkholderia xenovorans]|uniref:hypothetical protein n=1 Tax=Paraburkholderia xenovorans TaxID=36873 RepID=UPI0038BA8ED6
MVTDYDSAPCPKSHDASTTRDGSSSVNKHSRDIGQGVQYGNVDLLDNKFSLSYDLYRASLHQAVEVSHSEAGVRSGELRDVKVNFASQPIAKLLLLAGIRRTNLSQQLSNAVRFSR